MPSSAAAPMPLSSLPASSPGSHPLGPAIGQHHALPLRCLSHRMMLRPLPFQNARTPSSARIWRKACPTPV